MDKLASKYLFTLIQKYRSEMRSAIDAKSLNINAMHVQCLRYVAETPSCTANSIVQGLARDKSQISILIKDMVSKGWIERKPNQVDKRSKLLVLTDTGRELIDKVRQEEAVISARMQQGLSEEELAAFQTIIQAMIKNLN
ncbi:MarR family winged helix-turn-helix transcriptional regulator [Photobacterium sp. SDRW27]|uniref:MarR family winged helix-turn-helix transcriptional regulator n=1 Tax=Photobacterium obscurum TaxID=2829490 RepID=UPI0022446589|nr:MarR family winged helix-turn-helix transcriptional regulator [Photobacterium obscurum]MCW8328479.1 MarR family winged helix-turn-helix transcriptional regulator [Photobacterium obscurum]